MRSPGCVPSFILIAVVTICQISNAQGWEYEYVDVGSRFSCLTDRSIRLDGDGFPHAAYGGNRLHYARFNGTNWEIEIADSSLFVGEYASLIVDSMGYPHIAYYDETNGSLKYARKISSTWFVETIDNEGNVGLWTSIGISQDSKIHISYYDSTNKDLKHATPCDGNWEIDIIDAEGDVGKYGSLAVDALGGIYIAYHDSDNDSLKYAYRENTEWSITSITSAQERAVSIALDSGNRPHIGYDGWEDYGTSHAYQDGSAWSFEFVGYGYGPTSIFVDSGDTVHMVFLHSHYTGSVYEYHHYVRYATRLDDEWIVENIAHNCPGPTFLHPSIVVSDDSTRHFLFLSGSAPTHVFRVLDSWSESVIELPESHGGYPSLRIDQEANRHIAYCMMPDRHLLYAHELGGTWHIEVVDITTEIGGYISLELGIRSEPHISYYDNENRDMKYACKIRGNWVIETVDSSADVGTFSSLRIDKSGYPHISYYRESGTDLKYAYKTSSGWIREFVDISGDVGKGSSLALDSEDRPHISYYFDDDGLKYAHKGDMGWEKEIVEYCWMEGSYPKVTSLEIDRFNRPHISHYGSNYPERQLRYSYICDQGWKTEIIDNRDSGYTVMGSISALEIDAGDFPYIAYHAGGNGNIKFAYRSDQMWEIAVVDSGARYWDSSCSLALDEEWNACLVYEDIEHGALKFARGMLPLHLSIIPELSDENLLLRWNAIPEVNAFWVYGASNNAFFVPDITQSYAHRVAILAGDTYSWQSSSGVNDPDSNWTYLVMAVDENEQEIVRSRRVIEWDFGMDDPESARNDCAQFR